MKKKKKKTRYDPSTKPKSAWIDRTCLSCGGEFKAETRFLRMCLYCRKNA